MPLLGTDADSQAPSIGWPRAAATSVAVLGVAVCLLVLVPDVIVTRWHGPGRSTRVAVATAWFSAAFVATCVVLRRLQSRRSL